MIAIGREIYAEAVVTLDELKEANNFSNKNRIKLEYFKLEEENSLYGIEIVKKEYFDERETNIETEVVNNITNDECQANSILQALCKNKVTPITLNEIISDYKILTN